MLLIVLLKCCVVNFSGYQLIPKGLLYLSLSRGTVPWGSSWSLFLHHRGPAAGRVCGGGGCRGDRWQRGRGGHPKQPYAGLRHHGSPRHAGGHEEHCHQLGPQPYRHRIQDHVETQQWYSRLSFNCYPKIMPYSLYMGFQFVNIHLRVHS